MAGEDLEYAGEVAGRRKDEEEGCVSDPVWI